MSKKYTPISKRENIQDPDIAKVLDYIERHELKFEPSKLDLENTEIQFRIAKRFEAEIDGNRISVWDRDDCSFVIMDMEFKIFAANHSSLYASIRDYGKK